MSIESELAYLKSGEYKTHMEQILSGFEKEEAQDKHCHYGKACRAIKGLLKDQGIDADSQIGRLVDWQIGRLVDWQNGR